MTEETLTLERSRPPRRFAPLWVWFLIGGALLMSIILLNILTVDRRDGLEKGIAFESERKYFSAEMEFLKFMANNPQNIVVQGHLMIASFYNQDFTTFRRMFKMLKDKKIQDTTLAVVLEQTMQKAVHYFSSGDFDGFVASHPDLSMTPDHAWDDYFNDHPSDTYAKLTYAGQLFDGKQYPRCDSIVESILSSHMDFIPALVMGASVKREEGMYDAALVDDERLLQINRESVTGLCSKTRTLLLEKQDAEALEAAREAYKLDEKNAYVQASLILAYHFNNKTDKRDALIQKAMKDAADSNEKKLVQYAVDVVEKKQKFRD